MTWLTCCLRYWHLQLGRRLRFVCDFTIHNLKYWFWCRVDNCRILMAVKLSRFISNPLHLPLIYVILYNTAARERSLKRTVNAETDWKQMFKKWMVWKQMLNVRNDNEIWLVNSACYMESNVTHLNLFYSIEIWIDV